MRRVLSVACCAVYLAFGFVAGAAHVHEAADHHEETRGLHLGHTHLGDTHDHGPANSRHDPRSADRETHTDARHVEHHDGDAVFLTLTAQRSLDPGLRMLPAMIVLGAAIDSPSVASQYRAERADPPRGPPGKATIAPRAPPA